jgi:hypothetical protein
MRPFGFIPKSVQSGRLDFSRQKSIVSPPIGLTTSTPKYVSCSLDSEETARDAVPVIPSIVRASSERSILCEVKDLHPANPRFSTPAKHALRDEGNAAVQNDETFVIKRQRSWTALFRSDTRIASASPRPLDDPLCIPTPLAQG